MPRRLIVTSPAFDHKPESFRARLAQELQRSLAADPYQVLLSPDGALAAVALNVMEIRGLGYELLHDPDLGYKLRAAPPERGTLEERQEARLVLINRIAQNQVGVPTPIVVSRLTAHSPLSTLRALAELLDPPAPEVRQ